MTLGIYFAFIIFVMGTMILAVDDISEEQEKQFIQDVLKAHNHYRERHGSDPLELDQKMCDMTKTYMENLKTNPLEELPAEYGGNCYSIPIDGPPKLNEVPELNGKIGVKVMYRSGKDYDYSKEPLSHEKTDIFTQIVWKKTKKIGVGIATNNGNFVFIVTYSPAGNIMGEYMANVSKPQEAATSKNNDLAQEV